MADVDLDQLPLARNVRASVDELVQMAFQSSLTGLLNKAAYDALLKTAEDNSATAIAFMDLTGFKAINEKHSYYGGNATLVEAGKIWTEIASRVGGRAFHFSGDEFVLAFPDTRSREFVELVAALISNFRLVYAGEEIRARANVGLAHPDLLCGMDELFKRAERACKAGKAQGDDGVKTWTRQIETAKPLDVRWQCKSCAAVISILGGRDTGRAELTCAKCGSARSQD